MCLNSRFTIVFVSLALPWLHKTVATPASRNFIRESLVEVPFGETVTITCESNDKNHMFSYWVLSGKGIIIGPSNEYDNGKFKYEVLSGNLTIKAVSKEEEGVYNCFSRGVTDDEMNLRSVRMVVQADWEEVNEEDPSVNLFRVVVVLSSLMVISGVGYAGYRVWKTRHRHPSYLISSDDEEDSGEEIFRAPGSSRITKNMAKTNSTDSFEAPGISTDFSSILDTANNK